MFLVVITLNMNVIGDQEKTLSVKGYLDETKPYLKYLTHDLKTKGE